MSVFEILVTVEAGFATLTLRLPPSVGPRLRPACQLLRYVILPAALPFLFTAFRIGLVRAINATITAELFFAAVNLGALMKDSEQQFDTAGLLAIIVLLCLLGLVSQEGVKAAESVCCHGTSASDLPSPLEPGRGRCRSCRVGVCGQAGGRCKFLRRSLP